MGFVPQRQAAKKAAAHLREPDQKTSLAIDRAEDKDQRDSGNRSPKKSPVGTKGRHGKKVSEAFGVQLRGMISMAGIVISKYVHVVGDFINVSCLFLLMSACLDI